MNIPQSIHPFSQKTCLVVADHTHARLFLLEGQTAQEMVSISSEYPPKDNMERTSMVTPSGAHSAEESEQLEKLSWKSLAEKIEHQLMHDLAKHAYEEIIFFIPEDAVRQIQKTMNKDILANTSHLFPKILTNYPLPKILEHLSDELNKI